MIRNYWSLGILSMGMMSMALVFGAVPAIAEDAVPDQPRVAGRPSHWIGAMCVPAQGALRAQLDLPENQGLVVMNVVPDSPAATAGIQRHDILLTANDKPLDNPRTLSRLVGENTEDKLAITLLRGGKQETVAVTPGQRPRREPRPVRIDGADRQRIRDLIQEFVPEVDALPEEAQRLRLRFLQPGFLFGEGGLPADWPEKLSITVKREAADQPLKIVVQQDDKKWEINRDELGTLPDQLIPFVERMLGRGNIVELPEADVDIDLPSIDFPKVELDGDAETETDK